MTVSHGSGLTVGGLLTATPTGALPHGLFARITSLQTAGGNTVVGLRSVTLAQAVPEGDLDFGPSATAIAASVRGRAARAGRVRSISSGASISMNQGDLSCGSSRSLSLDGSLQVKPRITSGYVHLRLFHQPTVDFHAALDLSASASADIASGGTCSLDVPLGAPVLLGFIIVPLGPVVVTIPVWVEGKVTGTLSVNHHSGSAATFSASVSGGLHYENGHLSVDHGFTHHVQSSPPTGTDGELDVVPKLQLDVGFPHEAGFNFSAGVGLGATFGGDPTWVLNLLVQADAGVDLTDILSADVNLFTLTLPVDHGPPAPPPPPPPPVTSWTVSSNGARSLSTFDQTSDLSCWANTDEDFDGAFYDDTACGTFLAVGGSLYGPSSIPAGDSLGYYESWTPVNQTETGSGSVGDPYVVTTTVDAGGTGVELTETDSWVYGDATVDSSYAVTGQAGDTEDVELYRAADCYVGDDDTGYGTYDPSTQTVGCIHDYGDGTGVAETQRPLSGPGQSIEGFYDDIWADIATQAPFDAGCDCGTYQDNGQGTSWTLTLNGTTPVTVASRLGFYDATGPVTDTAARRARVAAAPKAGASHGHSSGPVRAANRSHHRDMALRQ